jgi:glycosyltransferase involved in cell wall biosynthesis
MKIFLVGTAYPYRGGITHFNTLLYRTLTKRGHSVNIISFKRQYPSLFFPGKTQYEKDSKFKVPAQQLIDSINPFNWLLVGRLMAKQKPDLVVLHHWMPFFGPAFGTIANLVKKAGAKTIFICHNIVPHESQPFAKFLTKNVLRKSDYYIVLSAKEKKDLQTIVNNPIVKVVYHPVYELFDKQISQKDARKKLGLSKEFVVLFFGHIRKYKGLQVLLDAIKIARKNINLKLVIAGEFYDSEEIYTNKIKELSLEKDVLLFNHFIPSDQIGLYFTACDVVALPYLSATQSGVIQICYNYNKPVISSRVGGLPEFIDEGKTGLMVPPNNPTELAKTIVEFAQNNYAENFSEHIKEYKKRFSWDTMAHEIESFIQKKPNE